MSRQIYNLPQLQNLIKRDSPAYRDEFLSQWAHYTSTLQILQLSSSNAADRDRSAANFRELVSFVAQVAGCYPDVTGEFAGQVMGLLLEQWQMLSGELRTCLVQNLVMMRNRDVISSIESVLFSPIISAYGD